MTTRERILTILRGEKPDRLPWCADLYYWMDYLMDERLMPEKYLANNGLGKAYVSGQDLSAPYHGRGVIDLHRDLDTGYYLQGYFPFDAVYDGVDVTDEIDGLKHITTIRTPFGDMREIWEYSYQSHSWGPREYLVKDIDDLKKVRYWYEHMFYKPNYTFAEDNVQLVGDQGVVLVYMPKCPIMEMIALKAGIMNVSFMIADDEDEWKETMDVMERKHDEACEIALNCPADCIMIPDNLSSGSIGQKLYREYAFQYSRKWTDRIRQAGKFSFVHLDGTVNPLLSEVSEAGFDVVEGLTPAPTGDMVYEEMRGITKKNAILWGGIPGGFFTPDYGDAAFDDYVIRLIDAMKKDGRSVLAVGDQVPPRTSFERIRRVARLAEEYGYYS